MRPAAEIKDWLSREDMLEWLRSAPDKSAYQRRLAIWLTYAGRIHAHKVAAMLGVSTPAVWTWIREYNTFGPLGLNRRGRGGRKRALMSRTAEKNLLLNILKENPYDHPPDKHTVKVKVEQTLGHKVSLSYIYKLLQRHNWPNVQPDTPPLIQPAYTLERLLHPWRVGT